MKIVVFGGTGLIGSRLVVRLAALGHEAVAGSRKTGVNAVTGEGLAEALQGASVVVDVTNSPSFEENAVMQFFKTSTTNMLAAEAIAEVGHHIALCVVGTASLTQSPYFRAKEVQERLIREGTVPYTIVQGTQFFEFIEGIGEACTRDGAIQLPPVQIQPMAADEVVDILCRIVLSKPRNATVEIAGPKAYRFDEIMKLSLDARKDSRSIVVDPKAPYFGAELHERSLIPTNGAEQSTMRFEDWLSRQ